MESSDATPQTGTAREGPQATAPFEVVRRAEFVFEPFMGSLIQLPEVRMERAQSTEFFLPQSPMHAEAATASANAEARVDAAWLPAELRAANLQIEEQQRPSQKEREKPAQEKKRGLLKPGSAQRAEVPKTQDDSRVHEITPAKSTARWEEIAAPAPTASHPVNTGLTAADAVQTAAKAGQQAVDRELTAALSAPIVPTEEATPTEEAIPAQEVVALREAVPTREADIKFEAPESPPFKMADSLTTKPAEEEEKAAGLELPVSQPVSKVAADAASAAWEVELAQALLAQAPIAEEEEPRKKKEKLSLATRLERWLVGEAPTLDGNRRRAERRILPGLVAFYWSGGVPRPHEIVNISKTGFYMKTTEFWSVETLVRMTLQRPVSDEKRKRGSVSVLARVVRIDQGGVGHEFVTTEALMSSRSLDVMPSQGTDWRELDRFLDVGE